MKAVDEEGEMRSIAYGPGRKESSLKGNLLTTKNIGSSACVICFFSDARYGIQDITKWAKNVRATLPYMDGLGRSIKMVYIYTSTLRFGSAGDGDPTGHTAGHYRGSTRQRRDGGWKQNRRAPVKAK